ncbi:Hypothetical protein I596_3275 [Dokdonella koreensis DS-123]|uniref:Uncharacterized protein n=1 Tax=Dokdonella koreensis DS-123 TaxID=1300342 RepID=A0A160DXK0_9GAMM|nr:Hypothetical protein I596_3275 [Dokdonella koreensis DS-123]
MVRPPPGPAPGGADSGTRGGRNARVRRRPAQPALALRRKPLYSGGTVFTRVTVNRGPMWLIARSAPSFPLAFSLATQYRPTAFS